MKSDGMVIVAAYRHGDKVRMEGGDIIGVVTTMSVVWREHEPLVSYEASWFNNGVRYSAWFHAWQLTYEGTIK